MSCFSWLCQSNQIIERDPSDILKDQLRLIHSIYPQATYPSIISPDGILVATLVNEEVLGIDLTVTISALKTAAKHFTNVLGFTGCPHLKIRGENQIFSLYSLFGGYILVFFTTINSVSSEDVEDEQVLDEQIKRIVGGLNLLLDNLVSGRKPTEEKGV